MSAYQHQNGVTLAEDDAISTNILHAAYAGAFETVKNLVNVSGGYSGVP